MDILGSTPQPSARHESRTKLMHHDHHLPPGLVGLHHAMRLADLLELEDPRWFGLVAACGNVISNALKRDVRERKPGVPKTKLPKKVR